MSVLKDLPELIKAEVITQETANRIQDYYKNKSSSSTNRLFIVFGILGAILVGLGIILIIAHNWDELSRSTKTLFAFLPLLIGQILCGFVLLKKQHSVAWRESGTVFLFFSIGACISLISQIYNIPGNLSSFLLTWMLLCLPLIYVMKSSISSLLYLIGITYYVAETNYWSYPSNESYLYWLLLLMALPHYYFLYKKKPESNFMVFHNWIIPLSLVISLGTVAKNTNELMFIAYFNLFGLLYLIGNLEFFTQQKSRNNGYRLLGSLGTIVLLLILSFDWFWEDLRRADFQFDEIISAPEFLASAITLILAGVLFYLQHKNKALRDVKPIAPIFILFIATFILGLTSPYSVVLINIYVLAIGILTIRDGAKQDHLGILNYGLLIITVLVICRFFDTDLSFVIRGILFVSVGAGFFAANYWMLKKRKVNE
ncbi:DUF2157 domain-containing protein [Allomuricauda sp. SCSIO 65647]|uniref:DUF2157 domain-containing protein n=1 Tax=Allomuricauda sp. SCSIO 65647 TaxID=2908843 RepID=UPI001F456706|nr:DUF2157 domain-containing protein [Muricauda sp. SCSIO 65647]UJH68803.1 DUF2157 domain-containing protein [Muricauda sp. SCSIO 65647]